MNKIGVYILRCSNNRYYIGSTDNFTRRISEHQQGMVKSTKNILPVELMFFKRCSTLKSARQLEYKLKVKKSRKIIDRIIKDGYMKMGI